MARGAGPARGCGGGRGPFCIRVCCGSACIARGALEVLEAIRAAVVDSPLQPEVESLPSIVGCHGWCSHGPLVEIPELEVLYCGVSPTDAPELVHRTALYGEVIDRLLYSDHATGGSFRGRTDNPFFAGQRRLVLARCGVVDPEDIDDALAMGAYRGLRRAIGELGPEAVIDLVKRSGLRERGGPGFPVGLKWALVSEAPDEVRYVVCNGEGGEPGLAAERTLLEGDPHGVIEGMVIAGFAVGARAGRLLLRSEHGLAVARVRRAVAQARRRGLIGPGVLGSPFEFEIEVHEAAGASVGGEETAMINALQGRRAVARPRPPFPATSGLWGRPTLINGVETLANIPHVVGAGADGSPTPSGTKVIAVSGSVARPGVAEVELGTTVGEVLFGLAGGGRDGREIRAVHVGGPGGITLGSDAFSTPLDHDSLRELDAELGSGGLVALDDGVCVVALARHLVAFCAEESCGICPPCRIGTRVVLNLLDGIRTGAATPSDVDTLEQLCHHIRRTSMCELGRTAPVSVIAGLRRFRNEYQAHLADGGCPSGSCTDASPGAPLSAGRRLG